jgi:hypothetical protein
MLHIITPFSRFENANFYIDNLQNKNVIWHPIVYTPIDIFSQKWIEPYIFFDEAAFPPNICKINSFMKNYPIIDNDRYCFMNDDDWLEDNVFRVFKTENDPDDDVVFISMKRGYGKQPGFPWGHPTFTLEVDMNRIIIGNIGFEQYFIKGRVLKTLEFDNYGCFDGLMAMELNYNYKVKPMPYVYAMFNYLEPGRWDISKKGEVVQWRLPVPGVD